MDRESDANLGVFLNGDEREEKVQRKEEEQRESKEILKSSCILTDDHT